MVKYVGPKDVIDKALLKLDAEKRAQIVKRYNIIHPGGLVEVEVAEEIKELEKYKA